MSPWFTGNSALKLRSHPPDYSPQSIRGRATRSLGEERQREWDSNPW
ncbi:MAG: hypothetical protein AB8F34_02065 [Akkermansiaceae bacterium]